MSFATIAARCNALMQEAAEKALLEENARLDNSNTEDEEKHAETIEDPQENDEIDASNIEDLLKQLKAMEDTCKHLASAAGYTLQDTSRQELLPMSKSFRLICKKGQRFEEWIDFSKVDAMTKEPKTILLRIQQNQYDEIEAWLSEQHGFVKMRVFSDNHLIFALFACSELARNAFDSAVELGYSVDFAKREMIGPKDIATCEFEDFIDHEDADSSPSPTRTYTPSKSDSPSPVSERFLLRTERLTGTIWKLYECGGGLIELKDQIDNPTMEGGKLYFSSEDVLDEDGLSPGDKVEVDYCISSTYNSVCAGNVKRIGGVRINEARSMGRTSDKGKGKGSHGKGPCARSSDKGRGKHGKGPCADTSDRGKGKHGKDQCSEPSDKGKGKHREGPCAEPYDKAKGKHENGPCAEPSDHKKEELRLKHKAKHEEQGRRNVGESVFEGTFLRRQKNTFGWVKPACFEELPDEVQTKAREMADAKRGGLFKENVLFIHMSDVLFPDKSLSPGDRIKFKLYVDNEGAGVYDVSRL